MRQLFIWHEGDWVPANQVRRSAPSRGPSVISDHLDGLWNPADGRHYDSRSAYFRTMKAHGCEIDDRRYDPKVPQYEPEGIGQDIKRAMEAHGL